MVVIGQGATVDDPPSLPDYVVVFDQGARCPTLGSPDYVVVFGQGATVDDPSSLPDYVVVFVQGAR